MSCPEVSAREKEETELLGSSISQEKVAAGRREWFDPGAEAAFLHISGCQFELWLAELDPHLTEKCFLRAY